MCICFLLPAWGSLIYKTTVGFSAHIWSVTFPFIQLEMENEATESRCLSYSLHPDFQFHPHDAALDLRKRPTHDVLKSVQYLPLAKALSYVNSLNPSSNCVRSSVVPPLSSIKNQKLSEQVNCPWLFRGGGQVFELQSYFFLEAYFGIMVVSKDSQPDSQVWNLSLLLVSRVLWANVTICLCPGFSEL